MIFEPVFPPRVLVRASAELIQVNFLTEGILAKHTLHQSSAMTMKKWADGAAAREEEASKTPFVLSPMGRPGGFA